METAADIAKKFGLETYLDRPAELNELIFKLLLLQETMQFEAAEKNHEAVCKGNAIAVRRIAAGKFVASCRGDQSYRHAVETALKGATTTIPLLHHERFVQLLASMGVPEEKVTEYSSTAAVSDDTLCIDRE